MTPVSLTSWRRRPDFAVCRSASTSSVSRPFCIEWTTHRSHRRIAWATATVLTVPFILTASVSASEIASTFERTCAGRSISADAFQCSMGIVGCHAGGGNVLGGRTLRLNDLEATGLTDIEEMSKIIYSGNKRMPGFGIECAPRVRHHRLEHFCSGHDFRGSAHLDLASLTQKSHRSPSMYWPKHRMDGNE